MGQKERSPALLVVCGSPGKMSAYNTKKKGPLVQDSGRREERVQARHPMKVEGATAAVTRDVSLSGVFFETDGEFAEGNEIRFSIELDAAAGPMLLECTGRIVRIERQDGKFGIATKILESKMNFKKSASGASIEANT